MVAILLATALTSSQGIFAAYTVDTLSNIKIGGGNSGKYVSSKNIGDERMGAHHFLRNVTTTRDLDVQLRKVNPYSPSGYDNGPWKIISNNKETQLTNSSSLISLYMQGGDFRVYVDSRWYYIGDTTFSAKWQLGL